MGETSVAARDDPLAMKLSALFDPEPATWGLRGDPHLWRALREHLSGTDMPTSAAEAVSLLHRAFGELVGVDLDSAGTTLVHREQYAHGGMSSGMISLDAWRQHLMPLLAVRAQTLLTPDPASAAARAAPACHQRPPSAIPRQGRSDRVTGSPSRPAK